MRPAFSDAFDPATLAPAPRLDLPAEITREWAWGASQGEGVKVAVIDSGIDADHPLVGRVDGAVAFEYDADAEEGVRRIDGPHSDLYGHGTACAAIIRALAPAVELHSVRVLGAQLTGKAHVFAAGLEWAIDNGMHVINLSLSTTNDDWFGEFHALADRAAFHNAMLVGALSNERKASYPTDFASVFSVAARDGRDPEHFAYNPNPPAEWGAPGIDVEVAWKDGATIKASGNSFAAPHIAGLVARVMAKHPGLTPFQMKTVLAALADNAR